MNAEQQAYDIALRRCNAIESESACFDRRDDLAKQQDERGLSAVQTHELRILDEWCNSISADWERQAQAEIWAEGAAVRHAESLGYGDLEEDMRRSPLDPIWNN